VSLCECQARYLIYAGRYQSHSWLRSTKSHDLTILIAFLASFHASGGKHQSSYMHIYIYITNDSSFLGEKVNLFFSRLWITILQLF